jgi:hypothetical protein
MPFEMDVEIDAVSSIIKFILLLIHNRLNTRAMLQMLIISLPFGNMCLQ